MTKTTPITVLCVDDAVDITRLIAMAIASEEDMDVVGELNSAENLLEELRDREPDVMLLDLTMPGVDVMDALPEIVAQSPKTRTVVFSGHDDQQRIDAVIEAGAWGYISKNVELPALLEGIRQVARGEVVALR